MCIPNAFAFLGSRRGRFASQCSKRRKWGQGYWYFERAHHVFGSDENPSPDDDLFICRLPQELKSHLHAQELHELLENLEPGLLMSKSTSEMKLEFLSNGQI